MLHLRPSDIYFTQLRVSNHFKKGTAHSDYYIGQTLDDLCNGRCTVSDIPPISVQWEHGKWWTADNRRLWVFRHYERLGGCTTIPVQKTDYIDPRKKSTLNGGRSVVVRDNSPGGIWWRDPDGALSTKPKTSSILSGLEDELSSLSLGSSRNLSSDDLEDERSLMRSITDGSPFVSPADELSGIIRSGSGLRYRPVSAGRTHGDWGSLRDQSDQTRVLTPYPASVNTAGLIRPETNRIPANVTESPLLSILDPEKVKFTKKQICVSMEGRFASAPSSVYKLWMNLVDGGVIPEYIPPIDVYEMDGDWWVVSGNRRLWAFKQAASVLPGLLIQARVHTGDQREFLRMVNENNQSCLSLEDVLSHGDDVEIVDNMAVV